MIISLLCLLLGSVIIAELVGCLLCYKKSEYAFWEFFSFCRPFGIQMELRQAIIFRIIQLIVGLPPLIYGAHYHISEFISITKQLKVYQELIG